MSTRILFHALAAGAFALAAATGAQAALVSFVPQHSTVELLEEFTVDVVGSGFDPLVGFGLKVDFDPAIVQVLDVAVDQTVWKGAVEADNQDNVLGTTGLIGGNTFDFLNPPTGSFRFATIEFRAVGLGVSPLIAADAGDLIFTWSLVGGETPDLTGAFSDGSITVVPLPATIWLLLVGLGALGARMRLLPSSRHPD